MLSKMSFLNKSIIKSDIKRFWWLSVLNMLVTFFSSTFFVMDRFMWRGVNYGLLTELPSDYYSAIAFGMIFAVLTTVAVFSYLNKSEQVAFAHALPNTRKKQYLSHLISALLLCGASGAINAIAIYLYTFHDDIAKFIPGTMAIKFFAVYMIYSILLIALTAFTGMLTASSVACAILTACFVAIPVALEGFIKAFCEAHVFGFSASNSYITHKIFYIEMERVLSAYVLIYLAIVLILLFAGYFLYKIRGLECSGEVCAFYKTRPVFIYTVALFTGMASYLYFGNLYSPNIFYLLPFGILGVVIAYMLSRKSFNLKGVYKPVLIYTLAVFALFMVIKFDITGYERRIPGSDDVEYVEIFGRYEYDMDGFYAEAEESLGEKHFFRYAEPADRKFESREDIKNIINLHEHIISVRNEVGDSVVLSYKLKNGKTLYRHYNVSVHGDREYLESIYNSEKYRGIMFELANGQKRSINKITVYDNRMGELFAYPGEAEINKLTEAIIKDFKEMSYEDVFYNHQNVGLTSLSFAFEVEGSFDEKKFKDTSVTRNVSYTVTPLYKNTISVLKELGVYDLLPTAEDVYEIGVNIYKLNYDEYGYMPEATKEYMGDGKCQYYITTLNEIKEIYSFMEEKDIVIYPEDIGNYTANVFVYMNNGKVVEFNLDCHEKYWPSAIKKFIEE